MTASILISIETGGKIDSHHIQLDAPGAERFRETLERCPGLMPAEASGRLANVFLSLEGVTVTKIDTSAVPAELAPAAPAKTSEPGPDALAAHAGIPINPAPESLDGAPV